LNVIHWRTGTRKLATFRPSRHVKMVWRVANCLVTSRQLVTRKLATSATSPRGSYEELVPVEFGLTQLHGGRVNPDLRPQPPQVTIHTRDIQLVRVIRHKVASPPHTDGSIVLARLRPRALLSNTQFPGPTPLSIPNCILIGTASFAQITAGSPYTFAMGRHFAPQNCPFAWRYLNPHLIHGSLGPCESTSQTAARSVQPFLQGSWSSQTD